MLNNEINANVKKWYLENFSDDEVGQTLNDNATFFGVAVTLLAHKDVYDYLGEHSDSIVRERVFEKLSEIVKCYYDEIYYLWLDGETTNDKRLTNIIKKIKKLIRENHKC